MDQITLKDLQKHINEVLHEHPELKDRKVVISNDNEGNSFHGLFYGITFAREDVEPYVDDIHDSCETDPDKIVILG